jgi:pyruvate/2-oxoacid:ferredoxin oxidoreductase alpha subunit
MENPEKLATYGTKNNPEKLARYGTQDNPEKLATYGTQDNPEKLATYGTQNNPEKLSTYGTQDNPEKLSTYDTQDEEKHNTLCVGHHYAQASINIVTISAQKRCSARFFFYLCYFGIHAYAICIYVYWCQHYFHM